MTRNELLDLYFLDARARLIDIAAFLDRLDRAEGDPDFRLAELRKAIPILTEKEPQRARKILEALSDPTSEPIDNAPGKGAVGAWAGGR
jgi:Mg/Co/Ni transporter MgtE